MNRLRYFWVLLALSPSPGLTAAAPRWNEVLDQPAAWYASAEARIVADQVLLFQRPEGGWPKNVDMTAPPAADFLADAGASAPTIDNGATTTQLRFLALVQAAQPDPRWSAACARGLDYLLAAQHANGGWPQFYPLRKGYSSHITYNDNAMVNVLTVLRDVAAGTEPWGFVDGDRRARAAAAVERGIACILRTQVRQDGKLTAWCAQHDEHTLAPAWARKFEPPSLSGQESVGVVRFLMSVSAPTPEIIAAVEGAVAWFAQVQLTGVREERPAHPELPHRHDRVLVPDPVAPPLWARFYELGTNRPIYTGRDGIVRYALAEIEAERRGGYSWHNDAPAKLLERDYPRWRKKHHLP